MGRRQMPIPSVDRGSRSEVPNWYQRSRVTISSEFTEETKRCLIQCFQTYSKKEDLLPAASARFLQVPLLQLLSALLLQVFLPTPHIVAAASAAAFAAAVSV